MNFRIASILLAASANIYYASGAEFGPRPALRALAGDGTDGNLFSKSCKGRKSGKEMRSKSSENEEEGYPSRKRQVSEW